MNQIPNLQNSQKQLERLAAQRELYSSAKNWYSLQLILTVFIPILLAGIAIYISVFAQYSALYGIIVFLFDIAIIDDLINRKRIKAAKIQELFDCDVLEIPKSPLKTVDDITVEEVLIYYKAHLKIKSNVEKIRDWYSPTVGQLTIKTARLVCQRANCWWDSKLRDRYANALKLACVIIFVSLLIISYFANLKLIEVTLIASTLIPYFQFSIRQYHKQIEASDRLNKLVGFSLQIWNEALKSNCNEELMLVNSRRLQDEIFDHRSKSPLILDSFYNFFRNKDEELMNRASEILIEEAIQKGCI